jgi:hypothetical protein
MVISFNTDEQRLNWVATADHERVWRLLTAGLKEPQFNALLYDIV